MSDEAGAAEEIDMPVATLETAVKLAMNPVEREMSEEKSTVGVAMLVKTLVGTTGASVDELGSIEVES